MDGWMHNSLEDEEVHFFFSFLFCLFAFFMPIGRDHDIFKNTQPRLGADPGLPLPLPLPLLPARLNGLEVGREIGFIAPLVSDPELPRLPVTNSDRSTWNGGRRLPSMKSAGPP